MIGWLVEPMVSNQPIMVDLSQSGSIIVESHLAAYLPRKFVWVWHGLTEDGLYPVAENNDKPAHLEIPFILDTPLSKAVPKRYSSSCGPTGEHNHQQHIQQLRFNHIQRLNGKGWGGSLPLLSLGGMLVSDHIFEFMLSENEAPHAWLYSAEGLATRQRLQMTCQICLVL